MNFRWLLFRYLPPGMKISTSVRRKIRNAEMSFSYFSSLILVVGVYLFVSFNLGMNSWLLVLIKHLILLPVIWLVLAVLGRWFSAGPVIEAVRKTSLEQCLACDYPRKGLGDDIHECPECGQRYGFESCIRCHQSLRGVIDARHCPECGADQLLPPPRPSFSWLVCQYIDARIPLTSAQISDARQRGLKMVGLRRHVLVATGGILIPFSIMYVFSWLMTDLDAIQNMADNFFNIVTLPLPILVLPIVIFWWITLTFLMKKFYAPAVRDAVKAYGHNICLGCGLWHDRIEPPRHCPTCGLETESD